MGEMAFPRSSSEYEANQDGLTKREWFAGQALQGLLASCGDNEHYPYPAAATEALKYADAMLEASNGPSEKGTS